jgi:hypothetical protein
MTNLTILLRTNNGRHEEGNIMLTSLHACVEKENKIIVVAKPRKVTKKPNPT